MKFTLPIPPSANRYWRQANGRTYVSVEAQAYKSTAGWIAISAGVTCTDKPVILHMDVYRPRRRGDLDNYQKITIDSLTGIAYADDDQIVEIHARRFDDKTNPRIELEVIEVA